MKILLIFIFAFVTVVNAGFFSSLFGGLTSTDDSTKTSLGGPGVAGFGRGGPPIQILAAGAGSGRPPYPATVSYAGGLGGGNSYRGGYSHGGGYAQGFGAGVQPSYIIKQSGGLSGGYSSAGGGYNGFNRGGYSGSSGGYGNSGSAQTIKLIHENSGGGQFGGSYGSFSGGSTSIPQNTIKLIHQNTQGSPSVSGGYTGGYSGGYSAGHGSNAASTIKVINEGSFSNAGKGYSNNVAFPSDAFNAGAGKTIRLIHEKPHFNAGYSAGTSNLQSLKSGSNYASTGGFASSGGYDGSAIKTIKVINSQIPSQASISSSYGQNSQISSGPPSNYKTLRFVSDGGSSLGSYSFENSAGPTKSIKVVSDGLNSGFGGHSYAGGFSHGSANAYSSGGATKVREQGGFVPSPAFGSSSGYSSSYSEGSGGSHSAIYSGSDYNNDNEQTIKIITENAIHDGSAGVSGNDYSSGSYSSPGANNNAAEHTLQIIDDSSSSGNYKNGFANDYSSSSSYSNGGPSSGPPSSYYNAPINSYQAPQEVKVINDESSGYVGPGYVNSNNDDGNSYANSYSSYSGINSGPSEDEIKSLQIIDESPSNSHSGDYSSNSYSGNSYSGGSYSGSQQDEKTIQLIQDNNIDSSAGGSYSNGGYNQQEEVKTIKIINENPSSNFGGRYQNQPNSYNSANNNIKTIQIVHENGGGNSNGGYQGGYSSGGYSGYNSGSNEHIKTIKIVDEGSRYKTKK